MDMITLFRGRYVWKVISGGNFVEARLSRTGWNIVRKVPLR
jgi:hypothetical protein